MQTKIVARHVHTMSQVPRMLGAPTHLDILPSKEASSVYWETIWSWNAVLVELVKFDECVVGTDQAVWRKRKKMTKLKRGSIMIE